MKSRSDGGTVENGGDHNGDADKASRSSSLSSSSSLPSGTEPGRRDDTSDVVGGAGAADFAVTVHEDDGGDDAVATAASESNTPQSSPEDALAGEPHDSGTPDGGTAALPPVSLESLGNETENNMRSSLLQGAGRGRQSVGGRRRGRRVRLETAVTSPANGEDEIDDGRASGRKRSKRRRKRSGKRKKEPQQLPLPSTQYECVLYRRAVRKQDEQPESDYPDLIRRRESSRSSDKVDDQGEPSEALETYGDVSLGMKLTVLGGKVIVQKLNALSDGRASPAQLAGVIRRGDVLLAINHSSLVNLPIDQLMKGLSPLSAPNSSGAYQRELHLRFAAGDGLAELQRLDGVGSPMPQRKDAGTMGGEKHDHGGGREPTQQLVDPANDMFALFPMVDQLSGMPLFDQGQLPPPASFAKRQIEAEEKREEVPQRQSSASPILEPPGIARQTGTLEEPPIIPSHYLTNSMKAKKREISLDEAISGDLARNRIRDRNLFISEFFAWKNDEFDNCLLKQPELDEEKEQKTDTETDECPPSPVATISQLVERGRRAIMGARAISERVEKVDRGKFDVRSFKSLKSTLSLYSRASARRRQLVFDAASVPVNFGRVVEEKEDDSSYGDDDSNEGEALDADEILLRLAANDDDWKKQVVEFLESAMNEVDEGQVDDGSLLPDASNAKRAPEDDISAALTNELGSFLFGDNMTKILTKRRKPQALPPEEITSVLFDLATKVSATIPDEITAIGSCESHQQQSPLGPFATTNGTLGKDAQENSNAMLATRFLRDKALPAWLKSFRPLPWAQRRILWPLDKPPSGVLGSTASSTLSDDSFTLESVGTSSQPSTPTRLRPVRKNLRERIEEQELDAETRVETYVLTCHFWIRLQFGCIPTHSVTHVIFLSLIRQVLSGNLLLYSKAPT